MKINKKLVAALLAGSISFSLVGCEKKKKEQNEDISYQASSVEEYDFLDKSNEILHNISDDYTEVLRITDLYFAARDNNDVEKLIEFYDNIRDIYLDYDDSKARKAVALIPYLTEAEMVFRNTNYTLNDEEIDIVNQLNLRNKVVSGYTPDELSQLYGVNLEETKEQVEFISKSK